MNIEAAKLDVVQKILSVKTASILEKINDILEREMIVAYTTEGKPLTKKAYNKRLEKAEQDILKGKVTSSGELRQEIKNW